MSRDPAAPRESVASRTRIAGGLAALGGLLVVAGAILPWLSLFGGLAVYPGVVGLKGQVLVGAGVVAALLGATYAVRQSVVARYAIGMLGFVTVLLASFFAAELVAGVPSIDGMAAATIGPGIFVSIAGGVLLVLTLVV